MTAAHERRYLHTLHGLVAADIKFCVLGTFALRQQLPALPRRLVADCDIMLPADCARLERLVQHLQATGWALSLWDEPFALPLTAGQLAGKYYLRARQAGAVLDCAYENDFLSWAQFEKNIFWHKGLPVLGAAEILRQKAQAARPTDLAKLRALRRYTGPARVAGSAAPGLPVA